MKDLIRTETVILLMLRRTEDVMRKGFISISFHVIKNINSAPRNFLNSGF